jgi:glyoxylase-like metal-dependent hydrolase (beta-lactamase superfamily II)
LVIHTLDLNFHGVAEAIAAYLIEGPAGPLLIETGPGASIPALTARLAEHGYAPADIGHALVTHIHLDHAGAAGWLAEQGTRIYVHPVGAPHLVDPARLLASAGRIYGDQMDWLWGPMLPVPAEQLTVLADGERVDICGLAITPIDTPGHAGHHFTYRIGSARNGTSREASSSGGDVAFTGDAAGVRLPGQRMVALPAPPPEFDLELWDRTLTRLADQQLARIYLTHFGAFDDVAVHLAELRELMHDSAAFVRAAMGEGVARDALVERYTAWNRARAEDLGVPEDAFAAYELANPLYMAVDGLMRYWRKRGVAGV